MSARKSRAERKCIEQSEHAKTAKVAEKKRKEKMLRKTVGTRSKNPKIN